MPAASITLARFVERRSSSARVRTLRLQKNRDPIGPLLISALEEIRTPGHLVTNYMIGLLSLSRPFAIAGLLRESVLHRYAQYCNVVRERLLIDQ